MAYSAISHMGFIFIGLSLASIYILSSKWNCNLVFGFFSISLPLPKPFLINRFLLIDTSQKCVYFVK
jgi:NADH:ubiquinone oxidoreductase subunit 4 (subunit M)